MNDSVLTEAAFTPIENYHPGHVIEAVNALQPLGKEPALARIESFLAGSGRSRQPHGLFWVLRVLYDLPAGVAFPPVLLGTPNLPPPEAAGILPRFPIVILRDIPFLLVRGYVLRGLSEPVHAHVDFFRAHGILRAQPLTPPPSLEGIDDEFRRICQEAYPASDASAMLRTIRGQIARLRPVSESRP